MNNRRQFLTRAAWSVAALSALPLAGCAHNAAAPAATSASPATAARAGALLQRTIPASGEVLPAIGVGTSGSYEVAIGSPEYAALKDVLKVFFEGGGTVIDTAPNYSNAEDVVGALLAEGGWRERCFLATKLAADDQAALEAQWAASKRRLRTAKVELLQVHNLRNMAQAWPYAKRLKEAGETRYIGVTHFVERAHAQVADVLRKEKPDFVQINYSVNAPQAARTVLPVARELGIAVIVNRAFDDGKLFARARDMPLPGWAAEVGVTSWAQMFLKFVLSHPAVTVVIPATGKPDRQADNLQGGIGRLLSQAQQDELVKLFA